MDTVFIHTNARQELGAVVGRHSLRRFAAEPGAFDVQIIRREEFPFFEAFEGRRFLRAGTWRAWRNDDLQSFTPLRFLPPRLMGHRGRALVIDPDVFAVGDVGPLLARDMAGRAVLARPRPGHNRRRDYIATSVMLLDCARLGHWGVEADFERMFDGTLDYEDWIVLAHEPAESIGPLEPEWNDFDRLGPETRLLHNTRRRTQPWKTGLRVDFRNRIPLIGRFLPSASVRLPIRYGRHPDRLQEALFFALLAECLDAGDVTDRDLEGEMEAGHLRPDARERVAAAPAVDTVLAEVAARRGRRAS